VYFKCGDTWNNAHLVIDWSGADADNRSITGAYYMDGSETAGVNVDGKPIFNTGWDLVTQGAGASEMTIQPYNASYIKIQDLKLINSHGYGIYTDWSAPCDGVHYKNILVEDTGRAGIDTKYSGTNAIIEYCKVIRDSRQYFIGESWGWDSGIRIRGDNGICRYCEVGNGWGEGIGVSPDVQSSNVLVENNLVWGRQSVHIYLGCCTSDGTVRNNVVIGTTNTDYHQPWVYGGRTWNGGGIGFNQEKLGFHTYRNKVYNNVVIGCNSGIQCLDKKLETVGTANRNYAYNNTLIDNYYNIWTHGSQEMGVEFKNNISYRSAEAVSLGTKHVWTYYNVGPTGVYRPLGNFWSSTPEYSQWEHASDVTGDPKLTRTSGWLSISTPSDIDIAADIATLVVSDAIDVAQNLGDTYDEAFITGCDFNTPDASDASTPIVVVTGDQDDYGAAWDFGAYVYTSSEYHVPYERYRGINRQKPRFNNGGRRFQ